MVFDIAIAVIVIFSMVFGLRAGFIYSFLHMIGWALSIVLAFVWAPKLKELLLEKTGIYDSIYRTLSERFTDAVSVERVAASLPSVLKDMVDSLAKLASNAAASNAADFFFTVTAFLLVVIAVKLILSLFISLLSKKYHGGVRGVIDGIFGLLIGFIKGIFIVFVLLALMIPVLGLFDSQLINVANETLDASYFARTLYDNNALALIIRDFLV